MAPNLRFAVLGPVGAWRADTELNLGAPQQQAVLVMLLLAGGRQVTLDGLIGGLWDDDPPARAVGTVRTYISRLRRGLDPVDPGRQASAGGLIRTVGTGYVLSPQALELDLEAFEVQTREARALRAAGAAHLPQAAALLRHALGLGHGVPLAGVPGPYADAQRTRITELQLAATEERLALDIELGSHVAAVPELQTLLTSHPLREGLTELLMLALYRARRQADALAVFDHARHQLADTLGVDPSPALSDMHQRILRRDDSLEGPDLPLEIRASGLDAEPPISVQAPAQLPAALPCFAGRQPELAMLRSILSSVTSARWPAIVAIDGMAGTGKTALAVHWAHDVAGQFPDGQLYANLRGFDPDRKLVPAGDVLRDFLDALGAASRSVPDGLESRAALFRSMLYGRRVLVVLDDAADSEQVRPLLPGSPGCCLVVTGRSPQPDLITAHGARAVTLGPFSPEDARVALTLRVGPARAAAERQALDEIAGYCGGLPLAIAVAAARATLYPGVRLGDVAGALRDPRTRLDTLSLDGAAGDLRAVLSWAYNQLTEPAQRVFRLITVHPGPDFSRNAMASLAGLAPGEAQLVLTELVRAGLLTESRPGRFTAHDLVRVYAAELSDARDTPADRRDALRRLLSYLLHRSNSAQLLLGSDSPARQPGPAADPPPGVIPEEPSTVGESMTWFAAELEVLRSAARRAAEQGFSGQARQLALLLQPFCQRLGNSYDGMTALPDAGPWPGVATCTAGITRRSPMEGQVDDDQ